LGHLGLLKLPRVSVLLMLILGPTTVVVLRTVIIIVLAVIFFPVRSLVISTVFVVVVSIPLSLSSKVLIAAGAASDISASKPSTLFVVM